MFVYFLNVDIIWMLRKREMRGGGNAMLIKKRVTPSNKGRLCYGMLPDQLHTQVGLLGWQSQAVHKTQTLKKKD